MGAINGYVFPLIMEIIIKCCALETDRKEGLERRREEIIEFLRFKWLFITWLALSPTPDISPLYLRCSKTCWKEGQKMAGWVMWAFWKRQDEYTGFYGVRRGLAKWWKSPQSTGYWKSSKFDFFQLPFTTGLFPLYLQSGMRVQVPWPSVRTSLRTSLLLTSPGCPQMLAAWKSWKPFSWEIVNT